jgi:chromosome segregation ATPase
MTLPDSKRCYQEFIEDMQYEYQTRLKIQESQNKESIEKAVIFQAQGSQLQEDTQYEIRTLQEQVYNQQESFRKCERENHELNEKVELLENQRQTLEGRIKTLENECEKNQKSGNSV